MVMLTIERVDCGTDKSEEIIAQDVRTAWTAFVVGTNGLDTQSPKYREERGKLTKAMVAAIPPECMAAVAKETVSGDPWKRSKLDIIIDNLVFDLLKDFPKHPYLAEWRYDKEYWNQFVSEKNRSQRP